MNLQNHRSSKPGGVRTSEMKIWLGQVRSDNALALIHMPDLTLPAQPVDATPSNRLTRQYFGRRTDRSQNSMVRLDRPKWKFGGINERL
jgi:hypothetical protein